MAVDINWSTAVITIAAADMVHLGSQVYQLDMEILRLDLMDQMDDVLGGMPWPKTHIHNPSVTVSGAVLAKVVIILAPYTITFDPTGVDAVNVVGANTNIADRTNVNSVGVRTSNSAGLQDLNSLQAASFNGAVALDATSAYAGTTFPVGTRAFAVNNLADAKTIAEERGLHRVDVMSSITFQTVDLSAGYEFQGDSPVTVTITLDPSTNVTNCEFTNATVTGTLDGSNSFERCHILNVNFFNGAIHNCSIEGTITLGGGITAELYDSWSGIAGGGPGQTATIDMGGTGQDLLMRNYAGGMDITNCTGPSTVSIDMNSGRIIFDPTISAGSFWVRGVADVYDSSTGTAVVVDQTSSIRAAEAVWGSLTTDYATTGTFGKAVAQIKSLAQAALGK